MILLVCTAKDAAVLFTQLSMAFYIYTDGIGMHTSVAKIGFSSASADG